MNKCPNCQTEFHCGSKDNEPCWCCDLPNIVPVNSGECLCPDCLDQEIKKLQKLNLKKILAISGSTRTDSSNEKLIRYITEISKDLFTITTYDISTLPYFNQDLDNSEVPESVIDFRKAIENSDGILICTPEYVFSIPGILKNAIEWTVSTVVFSDRPTAIITASSSGIKAHESLILVMQTVGVKMPEASALLIQSIKSKTNAEGQVVDPSTLKQLKGLIQSLNDSIQ